VEASVEETRQKTLTKRERLNQKRSIRQRAKSNRSERTQHTQPEQETKFTPRLISPKSTNQRILRDTLDAEPVTLIVGPSGCAKTRFSVQRMVQALNSGQIERIVATRPAVAYGKDPGAVPGDMRMKLAPYLRPVFDHLVKYMPAKLLEKRMQLGIIEITPLELLGGCTIENAGFIADEMQNCSLDQCVLTATRIGEGTIAAFNGDPRQIAPSVKSGWLEFCAKMETGKFPVVRLGPEDVFRSGIVRRVVELFPYVAV
jgi:phosphate starvation-inducible PhoH-like protein